MSQPGTPPDSGHGDQGQPRRWSSDDLASLLERPFERRAPLAPQEADAAFDRLRQRWRDLADSAALTQQEREQIYASWYVQEFGPAGHEDQLDVELAASQGRAERWATSRWYEIDHLGWRIFNLTTAPAWRAAVEGHADFVLRLPELEYVGGLSWEDIAPHLPMAADEWVDRAESLFEGAVPPDERDEEEAQIWRSVAPWRLVRTSALIGEGHQPAFRAALLGALADKGLLRGPCKSCGRDRWPVAWKQPGKAGRPRLADELCPICEAATRRGFKAGAKRRYQDRKRVEVRPAPQDS